MANILVVDDSATQRRLVGSLLEKRLGASRPAPCDWTVCYACHGQEALDLIARQQPDLVVTDLLMPGIDGLQLVEQIKKAHPTLPVILMTSHGTEDIALQALARGAIGYVPKHRLPKFLVDTVDNVLAMADNPARAQPAPAEHAPLSPAQPRPVRPVSLEQCWVHTETYYRLPNDAAFLTSVIGRLQANLRRAKLCDQNVLLRVSVALREALTNAMVHGNLEIGADVREADPDRYQALLRERPLQEPYSLRSVHLFFHESAHEVRFRIRDEGPGFDPGAVEAAESTNLDQERGRGLRIIRTFMDEVHHNERGNEITLVKRREGV